VNRIVICLHKLVVCITARVIFFIISTPLERDLLVLPFGGRGEPHCLNYRGPDPLSLQQAP